MKKSPIKFNYENAEYLQKLEELQPEYYSKYVRNISKYLLKKGKVLDVGCGTGTVLELLKKKGIEGYGCDISKLFIQQAKKNGLKKVYAYDGTHLPFENQFFDVIGSFNVLEHTENPEEFLTEELKKLKKGGYLIVACPNFLSTVLRSPQQRVTGIKNKLLNFFRVLYKLCINRSGNFERMEPVIREPFEYDDDAIVVTNLIDLKRFFQEKKCELVFVSGFINMESFITKILDKIPVIQYCMPSCFIIVKKT